MIVIKTKLKSTKMSVNLTLTTAVLMLFAKILSVLSRVHVKTAIKVLATEELAFVNKVGLASTMVWASITVLMDLKFNLNFS